MFVFVLLFCAAYMSIVGNGKTFFAVLCVMFSAVFVTFLYDAQRTIWALNVINDVTS